VFVNTTSQPFYGLGGQGLGEHGPPKDFRSHWQPLVTCLIIDDAGQPICTRAWPGNTANIATLLKDIDRPRQRFAIGRVCVAADRGMISAETITGLEERGINYIIGASVRSGAVTKRIVLRKQGPFRAATDRK
jgi:transposase